MAYNGDFNEKYYFVMKKGIALIVLSGKDYSFFNKLKSNINVFGREEKNSRISNNFILNAT